MKKVLIVGIDSPGYNSEGLQNGFRQNGHEPIFFNWQNERFNNGVPAVRSKAIELAEKNKPDLIFLHVQTKEILDVETVVMLQSIAPTVSYTFDVRDDISHYKELAPHMAHTFFACQDDVESCHSDGINNCSLLMSAANYEWHKPLPIEKSGSEIVFIANNFKGTNQKFPKAEARQEMIKFLYDVYGDNFCAYGIGQPKGMISQQEEIKVYNEAKICITQNLFDRKFYTSDRLFRAMGCGIFVLSEYFEGVEKLFKKEFHLDWWNDFGELRALIDFYLKETGERVVIADAGHAEVVENHCWERRFKILLEVIGKN